MHLVNINLAGVAPLVEVQFHIQTPKNEDIINEEPPTQKKKTKETHLVNINLAGVAPLVKVQLGLLLHHRNVLAERRCVQRVRD